MRLELAGKRIGRWVVEGELARGGQGVVLAARETAPPHGAAAVKVLLDRDRDAAKRFSQEARVLPAVRHPNLVRFLEVGESPLGPFLAMERVEGEDLAARVRRAGPPALAWTVATLGAVADCLGALHAAGVVHRDLKPENVRIEARSERAVLLDLGLVKRDRERLAISTLDHTRLSVTGEVLGTPVYMAPEQIDPGVGSIDPRTDVYGLGGLLHFLLTGRAPFAEARGRGVYEALRAVLEHPPPAPRAARPDVPAGVADLCRRCLAKDPAARPPSAAAFAVALRRAAAGPTGRGPARAASAALVAGAAVALTIAWAAPGTEPPAEPGAAAVATGRSASGAPRPAPPKRIDGDPLTEAELRLLFAAAARPDDPIARLERAAVRAREDLVGAYGDVEAAAEHGASAAQVRAARLDLADAARRAGAPRFARWICDKHGYTPPWRDRLAARLDDEQVLVEAKRGRRRPGLLEDLDARIAAGDASSYVFARRGLARYHAGRLAEAEADFSAAIDRAPKPEDAWYLLRAQVRWALEDAAGAHADALRALGRFAAETRERESAEAIQRRSWERLAGGRSPARGAASASEVSRWLGAVQALAVARSPEELVPLVAAHAESHPRVPELRIQLALALAGLGRERAARREADRLVLWAPDVAASWVGRAGALLALRDPAALAEPGRAEVRAVLEDPSTGAGRDATRAVDLLAARGEPPRAPTLRAIRAARRYATGDDSGGDADVRSLLEEARVGPRRDAARRSLRDLALGLRDQADPAFRARGRRVVADYEGLPGAAPLPAESPAAAPGAAR